MADIDSGNYASSNSRDLQYKFQSDLPERRFYKGSPIIPQSTSLFASQPFVYSSEWVDSTSSNMHNKTPSKQKANSYSYMTPPHEQKLREQSVQHQLNLLDDSSAAVKPKNKVNNWDVFWEMLNDLTGKDKLAKVGQYTLRLLLFHAGKTEKYLSDTSLNIDIINLRYNNKEKQLNLLRNFIKHPANFLRVVVILLCYQFQQKLSGMVFNLSIYRQFLRFGKSPFRLRDVLIKINKNVSLNKGQLQIKSSNLLNRSTLSQVFGLYYSIFDESLLLCKIGFYSPNWTTFRTIVGRHESLAWYYDTWLNLYNAYEKSQLLGQQEVDLKISIEVKNKARLLSRQILGAHTGGPAPTSRVSAEDAARLHDIQFSKTNSYLDIYKNISDIVFNSYTVFSLPLPFETLQIWMGISAAVLNSTKVYRETKKKLEEK